MDLDFGDFRLKRTERLLLGPKGPVELSARSFDILDALLGKPDEVVDKAHLFDAVWPGRMVEENTLQVHISALRRALPPGMIVTVHGRGYKYVGPKPLLDKAEPLEKRRPSIAVLPFDNMSGDPEQDYFSDGITEDIIAELSKFKDFLVIARNSSFQFRGKANDLAEVVKKLGVQYVVEGSVRKAANRIRVSAQLIDASSLTHVWAEHYDRELDDIFAIQDEITQMISARLARQARTAIASRARTRPTGNMSAYENYLRALQLAAQYETAVQAEPFLQKAVELDPEFAGARAMLGFVESIRYFWSYDPRHLESGLQIAKAALQLDSEEAYGHLASGFALMYMRRFREAETSLDRAVASNPNDPFILSIRALLLSFVGKSDAALAEWGEATRRDPFAVGWFEDFHGIILTGAGRYREALASFARMATMEPWSLAYVSICHAELGEAKQAEAALARLKSTYYQDTGVTLDHILKEEVFYEDATVLSRFRAALQRIDGEE
jgi:TolB-like protein